jgi:hypothetical protein
VAAPAQRLTDSSQPKMQPKTVPIEIDTTEISSVRPAASARKLRSDRPKLVKNWEACANSNISPHSLTFGPQ